MNDANRAGAERLADLTRPDPVWASMDPFVSWRAEPEECLLLLEELIQPAKLSERVPEDIRCQFEIVRSVFRHGFFQYDFFAQAADLAFLHAETALRLRFLHYYGNQVPFLSRDGSKHEIIETIHYEILYDSLHGKRLPPGKWLLESKTSPKEPHEGFDGSFNALLRWAFDEQLLPGRKGTYIAYAFRRRRNIAGHPSYRREPPARPASELCTVAELINCLWGERTEKGKLFPMPAPVRRIPVAIGKSRDGRSVWFGPTAGLRGWQEADRDSEVMIVLGDIDDNLTAFVPGFECTQHPCRLIWGPGRWEEAVDFAGKSNISDDELVFTDRIFLIRTGPGYRPEVGPQDLPPVGIEGVESPRSAEAFLALPECQRQGTWFVIQADFPGDALEHVVDKYVSRATELHKLRRSPRCTCGVDEHAARMDWKHVEAKLIT